jgi:uncharacterized membrane protein YeaQ/YmgE (transglycosylase-associated protein family)
VHYGYFVMIGLAAGWLADQVTRPRGVGLLGNLTIGAVGAMLGGWLYAIAGVTSVGLIGGLAAATVGAVGLLLLLSLLKRVN